MSVVTVATDHVGVSATSPPRPPSPRLYLRSGGRRCLAQPIQPRTPALGARGGPPPRAQVARRLPPRVLAAVKAFNAKAFFPQVHRVDADQDDAATAVAAAERQRDLRPGRAAPKLGEPRGEGDGFGGLGVNDTTETCDPDAPLRS
jgi:hypothetical protein